MHPTLYIYILFVGNFLESNNKKSMNLCLLKILNHSQVHKVTVCWWSSVNSCTRYQKKNIFCTKYAAKGCIKICDSSFSTLSFLFSCFLDTSNLICVHSCRACEWGIFVLAIKCSNSMFLCTEVAGHFFTVSSYDVLLDFYWRELHI